MMKYFVNKKILFAFLILCSFAFFIISSVFAYDSHYTHRGLTSEAADFYNNWILNSNFAKATLDEQAQNDKGVLTSDDIANLMQGAEDEDTPPRWINHFYNPITGQGWTAEHLGNISPDLVKWFSSFALSPRNPLSAKNWASNRSAQGDYASYSGDQTWQKAIELYAIGDRAGAMQALGHNLHLLEDMTVPDHTRNDTHAGLVGDKGSSYEVWVKDYVSKNIGSLGIAKELIAQKKQPLNYPSLDEYFNINSEYSANNFFSDDTINDSHFVIFNTEKRIDENKQVVVYKIGVDPYPLYTFKDGGEILNDPLIMSAYWQRLSRQAVISSAGAIGLFFKEAEAYKKLHPYDTKPIVKSSWSLFSPFGALVQAGKTVAGAFNTVSNFAVSLLPQLGKTAAVINIDELTPSVPAPAPSSSVIPVPVVIPDSDPESSLISAPSVIPAASPAELQRSGEAGTSPNPSQLPLTPSTIQPSLIYISHVIDGDTVTLSNGKDLRFIGINTPEVGEPCAAEATQKMKDLALGQYVRLEKDTSETDKYGRLLRYVYIGNVFVNAEMVKTGFAETMTIPPDTSHSVEFKTLEKEAKAAHIGCLNKALTAQPTNDIQPVGGAPDEEGEFSPYFGGSSYANPDLSVIAPAPVVIPASEPESTPSISTPESATSTPPVVPDTDPESSSTSTPETPPAEPTPDPPPAQDKILISEIQLAGQSADDEFIELYNPNAQAVSLRNWSIQYRGSSSANFYKKNFDAAAQIPGYGFYLISHKNYSASSTADMTYAAFSMSATGGTVALNRAITTLATGVESSISDKVGYYKNTPPADATILPETKEINIAALTAAGSMERKSNATSTAATMTQDGINEFQGNSQDTDNNANDFVIQLKSNPQNIASATEDPTVQSYDEQIICSVPTYGVHKTESGSANRTAAGLLEFPIILKGQTVILSANKTYYVDDIDSAHVPPTSRLIIEEGVVVKFNKWRWGGWMYFPPRMRVEGSLEINGTKTNPVIFTTFRDNEHGIVIATSTESAPAPGDWGSLTIESGNSESVKINGAKFFYSGGTQGDGNSFGGAIYINKGNADIQISDIEIAYSQSGIYSSPQAGNQPQISDSKISYNNVWGASAAKDTSIKITGSTFLCNGLARTSGTTGGINIEGKPAGVTIENNNFQANANVGLSYYTYKNETLSAPNNYWGSYTGPYHAILNPFALGDPAQGPITFSPWAKVKY
jgi:micrococcal nuclease